MKIRLNKSKIRQLRWERSLKKKFREKVKMVRLRRRRKN